MRKFNAIHKLGILKVDKHVFDAFMNAEMNKYKSINPSASANECYAAAQEIFRKKTPEEWKEVTYGEVLALPKLWEDGARRFFFYCLESDIELPWFKTGKFIPLHVKNPCLARLREYHSQPPRIKRYMAFLELQKSISAAVKFLEKQSPEFADVLRESIEIDDSTLSIQINGPVAWVMPAR